MITVLQYISVGVLLVTIGCFLWIEFKHKDTLRGFLEGTGICVWLVLCGMGACTLLGWLMH